MEVFANHIMQCHGILASQHASREEAPEMDSTWCVPEVQT